jgi:hypothetical protein
MRTVVIECNVSHLGASEDDTPATDVQQLHLIHLELIGVRDGYSHAGARVDLRFRPLACACITMVDADLVAVHQDATHPSAGGEQAEGSELESQHPDVGSSDHPASHDPRDGDQGHRKQIHEHVPRRATLARAARWDGEQVIDETRHGRHERSHNSGCRQVAASRPPARAIGYPPGRIEEKRAGEESERKGDECGVDGVPAKAGLASHRCASKDCGDVTPEASVG